MSWFRYFALGFTASLLLVPVTTRAEYDWYSEKEGSSAREEHEEPSGDEDGDDERDEGGGYVQSYENAPRASEGAFGLGLRFAYALPLGDVAADNRLKRETPGVLKGQLDLDYGWSEHAVVGLYLAVGGGFLPDAAKDTCDLGDASCKIITIESGLTVTYRILPHRLIDPWISTNLGLEQLRFAAKSDLAGDVKTSLLGLAFGAALGADVQFGDFGFGPYFSPQFGYFMRGKTKTDSSFIDLMDVNRKIDDRAIHYWLNFGLRARYWF